MEKLISKLPQSISIKKIGMAKNTQKEADPVNCLEDNLNCSKITNPSNQTISKQIRIVGLKPLHPLSKWFYLYIMILSNYY